MKLEKRNVSGVETHHFKEANKDVKKLDKKWGWSGLCERIVFDAHCVDQQLKVIQQNVSTSSHAFTIDRILSTDAQQSSTVNDIPQNKPLTAPLISQRETLGVDKTRKSIIVCKREPSNARELVQEMIERRDERLRYVNDGNAIVNPFAVSRKEQLSVLRKSLYVRPYACEHCPSRFTQRSLLEGHQSSVHQLVLGYGPRQRREELRICETCGFVNKSYVALLEHTVSQHPTNVDTISMLRMRTSSHRSRKEKGEKDLSLNANALGGAIDRLDMLTFINVRGQSTRLITRNSF
ncbi:unnamed protein product [Hydatigera taeniaeformis]|uniref:C2H2-type domain-containing protein n=1 Tax=Hydatigena taeniaeformis TaxID=6205 RepID=A0A0R3X6Z2_HYDTA|nr:unnamed protein product [Hydatigera taeniaeformis]